MGLILGSLPILFKKANGKRGFRLHYLLPLVITFMIAIVLLSIEQMLSPQTILIESSSSFGFLVFCGLAMSIGIVVPGVSSSVILMILGIYDTYLSAISSLHLTVLFPMAIGIAIGGFLLLLLLQYLLKKHFALTYYAIIGFILGSIFIVYPGFTFNLLGITCIACFIIGFSTAHFLENLSGE